MSPESRELCVLNTAGFSFFKCNKQSKYSYACDACVLLWARRYLAFPPSRPDMDEVKGPPDTATGFILVPELS